MFNPFNVPPVTYGLLNDAQRYEEIPGNVSERRSTTNHPMREVTTVQPSHHRESTRDLRAANPTSTRPPRRSEDLPEQLTSAEIALVRSPRCSMMSNGTHGGTSFTANTSNISMTGATPCKTSCVRPRR